MTGIARKKENSVAARRERPSAYPPMIVAPEREVPGTSESTWASPMPSAVRGVPRRPDPPSRGGRHRSISRITMPPDHQRGRHHRDPEQVLLDPVVGQEADDGGRKKGDQQIQQEAAAGPVAARRQHRLGQPDAIEPDDRQDGAELDEDVEGLGDLAGSARASALATIRCPVELTGMNSVAPSTRPSTTASSSGSADTPPHRSTS